MSENDPLTPLPNEELLRSVIEGAPAGILVVRDDGEIRRVNHTVEQLFGYSREELEGQQLELLVPEHLREVHKEHRRDYLAKPSRRPMGLGLHTEGRRKDGSVFPVEIQLSPVSNVRGSWTIAMVQDVTERVARERERNDLVLELEMQQERQRIGMDL